MIVVLAHGVGGRSDLPLPLWLFSWSAATALVVSFVALRILWTRPRLEAASVGTTLGGGSRLTTAGTVVLRALGLAALAYTLAAAWAGPENPAANLAPFAVFVVFWVGVQAASVLVGDIWRALDPVDTLARLIRLPAERSDRADLGHWTAAGFVTSFLWLELAYHDGANPRVIAMWLTGYLALAVAGAALWGRSWLRHGEGFAALFGAIGHLGPLFRDDDGHLRRRPWFSGLAAFETRPGSGALILVTLGGTTFDGLSRTTFWLDLVGRRTGWDSTFVQTLGFVFTVGVMAIVWLSATRVVANIGARRAEDMAVTFLPSLIPIVLGYALAHYFSLLVFESQNAFALMSDPLGRGWDLFGTIDHVVTYTAITPSTIAWVQVLSLVIGHVVGVVAAHDRAVSLWPPAIAERTQYPMLFVMILYTVGGLYLLLEA